jgi:hypothetical protein
LMIYFFGNHEGISPRLMMILKVNLWDIAATDIYDDIWVFFSPDLLLISF